MIFCIPILCLYGSILDSFQMPRLSVNLCHRTSSHIHIFTIFSLAIVGCVIILYLYSNSANLSARFIPSNILFQTDAHLKAAFMDSFGRLQSVLSPQLQWCISNPFLRHYDQSTVLDLELKWFDWTRNKLPMTYNMLNEYALSPANKTHEIVRLAYPESLPLPCPYHGGLKRYGDLGDGGKILCGAESLAPSSNFIVYSLGSGGNFGFELDLLNKTSCKIHTYDCTHRGPDRMIQGLTYHHICMGKASDLQSLIFPNAAQKPNDLLSNASFFRSFHQIVKDNNHTHVHVLKMDIEGGEYSVLADLLSYPTKTNLPYQICFESHWWNSDIYHAILHQHMFAQLWKYGYRFLQHDYGGDGSCVEWTLMRVFC